MAAIWKGSISFGLVNIPVELRAAVVDNRPRFHLLHAKDKSPVGYERVCKRENKPVPWKEIVKGFEPSKGTYVVLTKEDFERAAVEKTKTIDVFDFVPREQVDDRFFESSYFVLPGKGGERGYAVLREAIRDTDKLGIGKMVLREVQHLTALSVVEDALVLTLMRFADELVDVDSLSFPAARTVRPKELEMAKTLVKNLSDDWDPKKYHDDYRDNLMRIIKAKARGKTAAVEPEERSQPAAVTDLMERLRQSLAARTASGAKPTRSRRAKRRRAA